jgi:GNAT superfamily N-acetyltransferase
MTRIQEKIIAYGMRYGEVYIVGECEGAAIWLPPGEKDMTLGRIFLSGFWLSPFILAPGESYRFWQVNTLNEKLYKQAISGSYWYLLVLGVYTSNQGRGLGSRLLAPQLAKAAAKGYSCYLKTMNGSNLVFYRKHGFEVKAHGKVSSGLEIWSMVRPPTKLTGQ